MPKFKVNVYADVMGFYETVEVEAEDADQAKTLAKDQLASQIDQFTQQKVWEAGYEVDADASEL